LVVVIVVVALVAAVFFVGEFASMAIAEKATNDSISAAVDTLFGIASLLTAGGLLAAGWATLRAGRWSGWRRLTPLACGLWSLALIGFVFTDVRIWRSRSTACASSRSVSRSSRLGGMATRLLAYPPWARPRGDRAANLGRGWS
jgi:hypothetical protein